MFDSARSTNIGRINISFDFPRVDFSRESNEMFLQNVLLLFTKYFLRDLVPSQNTDMLETKIYRIYIFRIFV